MSFSFLFFFFFFFVFFFFFFFFSSSSSSFYKKSAVPEYFNFSIMPPYVFCQFLSYPLMYTVSS